jgi:hypothetical protein
MITPRRTDSHITNLHRITSQHHIARDRCAGLGYGSHRHCDALVGQSTAIHGHVQCKTTYRKRTLR